MKQVKIPASISLNIHPNISLTGKLSVYDGLFTPNNSEQTIFCSTGTLHCSYQNINFVFEVKNIGGKYFVNNYQNDFEYQKFTSLIRLENETVKKESNIYKPKYKI